MPPTKAQWAAFRKRDELRDAKMPGERVVLVEVECADGRWLNVVARLTFREGDTSRLKDSIAVYRSIGIYPTPAAAYVAGVETKDKVDLKAERLIAKDRERRGLKR